MVAYIPQAKDLWVLRYNIKDILELNLKIFILTIYIKKQNMEKFLLKQTSGLKLQFRPSSMMGFTTGDNWIICIVRNYIPGSTQIEGFSPDRRLSVMRTMHNDTQILSLNAIYIMGGGTLDDCIYLVCDAFGSHLVGRTVAKGKFGF